MLTAALLYLADYAWLSNPNLDWVKDRIPAQDSVLSRASNKLISDEGLLAELGANRLDRDLQKYIWNGKPHLSLKDLWEYLNRYTYLPRVKNNAVLVKAVQSAVSAMLPGPFAYAEAWDDLGQTYRGLVVEKAANAHVVIDRESVTIRPDVALEHLAKQLDRPVGVIPAPNSGGIAEVSPGTLPLGTGPAETISAPVPDTLPTRFQGTVMISADRPARDIHQIVEAIVEQLTTIAGSEVSLRLEIDAEVPSGLDRSKVRTLLENSTTLGFLDKKIS